MKYSQIKGKKKVKRLLSQDSSNCRSSTETHQVTALGQHLAPPCSVNWAGLKPWSSPSALSHEQPLRQAGKALSSLRMGLLPIPAHPLCTVWGWRPSQPPKSSLLQCLEETVGCVRSWRVFQSKSGEQGCLFLRANRDLLGGQVGEAVCLEPPGDLLGWGALSGLGAYSAGDSPLRFIHAQSERAPCDESKRTQGVCTNDGLALPHRVLASGGVALARWVEKPSASKHPLSGLEVAAEPQPIRKALRGVGEGWTGRLGLAGGNWYIENG